MSNNTASDVSKNHLSWCDNFVTEQSEPNQEQLDDEIEMESITEEDELMKTFKESSNTVKIKFLPFDAPDRLQIDKNHCFHFQVDAKFEKLFDWYIASMKLKRLSCPRAGKVTGPIGCGKTFLLASLYHFVTKLKRFDDLESLIIYIPSCRLLCLSKNPLEVFKKAMIEAFAPEARTAIAGMTKWEDIDDVFAQQPTAKEYISLILDDFNFIGDYLKSTKEDKYDANIINAINGLNYVRKRMTFVIEGLSARSDDPGENLFKEYVKSFVVDTGLDDVAWQKWLKHYFPNNSPEETKLLEEYTGRIPLYLKRIELAEGDTIMDKIESFISNPVLDKVRIDSLLAKHFDDSCLSCSGDELKQNIRNIVEANFQISSPISRIYDKRFYCVKNNCPVPINLIVARIMNSFLLERHTQYTISSYGSIKWENIKHSTKINNSVKGFVFEHYALSKIASSPNLLRVQTKLPSTPCEVVKFSGDYPSVSEVNLSSKLIFFWPTKFNLAYVDGVVRYLDKNNQLNIIAIQVTQQSPTEHGQTAQFFSKLRTDKIQQDMIALASYASEGAYKSSHISRYIPEKHYLKREIISSSSADKESSAKKRVRVDVPLTAKLFLTWVCPDDFEGDYDVLTSMVDNNGFFQVEQNVEFF